MSLEETTSPEQGDQVSGLLQNLQRIAQPCGTPDAASCQLIHPKLQQVSS